jgi:hypothetical protein
MRAEVYEDAVREVPRPDAGGGDRAMVRPAVTDRATAGARQWQTFCPLMTNS